MADLVAQYVKNEDGTVTEFKVKKHASEPVVEVAHVAVRPVAEAEPVAEAGN